MYPSTSKPDVCRIARFSHRNGLLLSGILLLVCIVILPVVPYVWVSVFAGDANAVETEELNPRANFWREVRKGDAGYSAIGGRENAVLINSSGQNWRQYRMNILAPYGSYLMGGVLIVIAAFFLFRGPVRLDKELSGRLLPRFSVYQRVVHWFTAILFWLLALTGLVLLYGRFVLIPLLGAKGFAITAAACKEAHNLFGPLFLVALILLFAAYVRDNFYAKGDFAWLKKGGGMFGQHASAGRFNMGEKIWFWLVCILGLTVSVTGLLLDFAVLGQGRGALALSHVLHGAAAIVFIAVSFGHIYLGTIGTKGTLRAMTTGYVDATWAEHHHDRWVPEPDEFNNTQAHVAGFATAESQN